MSINFHRRPRVPGASAAAANREALRQAVSPAAGPEQLAVAAEDRQRLWAAAARVLGEEEQTALWLHYVEQIPVEEIARVLDRSSAAVKTMMFRAAKSSVHWWPHWSRKGDVHGRRVPWRPIMDNYHKWIESSNPLAEQMRREAQSTRPEFSASLDARLRAAVRAAGPSALPTSERRKRSGQGLRWALAAAALVAVAIIGSLIWQAPRQRPGARKRG